MVGTLTDPLNLGALDLRLKLSGTSMANLYPLTGITLPDTPAYSTDGHLLARLKEEGGALFRYENFNGKVGASDLHGSLTFVARQPRPKLSGKLTSEQLRFADLGPLIGADSNAEKQARADQPPAGRQGAAGGGIPYRALARHGRRRGIHRQAYRPQRPVADQRPLYPSGAQRRPAAPGALRFGVAGKLESDIRLDGGKQPMQSRVKMSARGFKLKQLFPGFAPMQTSFGELNGDASLSGSGNSVAKILGGAGRMKMLINDGAISKGLTEIAGLNVGNYLVTKLFDDDEVKINCAAADFGLQKGLMTSRLFVFDTENALVNVDGTVNFANEARSRCHPHSKGLRIFSLRSPLYVRAPSPSPTPGSMPGRWWRAARE